MTIDKRWIAVLALTICKTASSASVTFNFENFAEGTTLTNQLTSQGVSVSGSPVIFTAGSLLNEIDFPPSSGVNVLVDTGGPITFTFGVPLLSVSLFSSYAHLLTFETFNPAHVLLQSSTSGAASHFGSPSQLFSFASPLGQIGSLRITGDPAGSSFTVDDLTINPVPEPGSGLLVVSFMVLLIAARRIRRDVAVRFGWRQAALCGVVCVLSPWAWGQPKPGVIGSLVPSPALAYMTTPPAAPPSVNFAVKIGFTANLNRNSVTLNQVTADGALIAVVGRMFDDGSNGDAAAGDNNFSLRVPFPQTTPAQFYYRATAAYTGVLTRSQSPIVTVTLAPPSFAKAPDPGTLVKDAPNHNPFPVNQLVFAVPPNTPAATITNIVNTVNGTVVGFSSTSNLYQVQVPATTITQLNQAIATVASNPAVTGSTKNYVANLEAAVINDLTNLGPGGTPAYDKVGATAAFQYLADTQAKFASSIFGPVTIGIVDTGVQRTHQEFAGVNFGLSPAPALTDTDPSGHGTALTGIVGANCVSCAGGTYVAGQMNGLLAGVPGPAAGSSAIPYVIESRSWGGGTYAEVNAAIDDLINKNANVILIGLGWEEAGATGLCPAGSTVPTSTCMPVDDFVEYSNELSAKMRAAPGILFVVAAGNSGVTSAINLPARLSALGTNNVVAVGATDLSDARCVTPNCSFSSNIVNDLVDMAAPGTSLYVPAPPNTYNANFQGTSGSAALVAGAAGLLHAIRPNEPIDGATKRKLLKSTADSIASTGAGVQRLNLPCAVGACLVDVFFLIDTTGSMGGAIDAVKAGLGNVIENLSATGANVDFGVGQFKDYPIDPYGGPGDFPYARVADIAPLTGAFILTPVKAALQAAVNGLTATGGNDTPESQLAALFQAATGAGQPPYIAPNLQVNWRTCPGTSTCRSVKIIVLITDASFHRGGSYPGPADIPTVKTALAAKGIAVIGIQPNDLTADAVLATSDLKAIASVAPKSVSCDTAGQTVAAGAPLVCLLPSTAVGMETALTNAILPFINQ